MQNADLERLFKNLGLDGEHVAEKAFKQALANVEATAKELVPIGVAVARRKKLRGTGRTQGRKKGGQLKSSLRVAYLGKSGTQLVGRCTSELPYARRQHEGDYHHPGKYVGSAMGAQYKAKYFERAFLIVLRGEPDPLMGLGANGYQARRTFAELLVDLAG